MTPRAQAELIALHLGKPWKYLRLGEESNWWFEIIDGAGRGLHIRVDGQKFKISGDFPRGKTTPWREDYKTIGVSIARPAKDIAADILRRLIPHYLDAWEKAVIRYQEEQEKESRLNLIAQSLVKVTGGRLANNGRSSRSVYFNQGDAEIWSGGDITLTLRRLAPEQAIQIADMVRRFES